MMKIWIYTLFSVILVSLISLCAVFFLSWSEMKLKKILFILVSFAVGGLFGDAFIHLIPESFHKVGGSLSTSLYILTGILLFFILERFIHWRHCHNPECGEHAHPMVTINLIGDGIHNAIDGILIGASYLMSIPLGIATTIAVILHEIPHEIGNFGVLVHGGLTAKKALFFNFLSALTAILGAVAFLIIGSAVKGVSTAIVPITAGGFVYIAGSDLIPELKHEEKLGKSILQLVSILLGIGMMSLLKFLG